MCPPAPAKSRSDAASETVLEAAVLGRLQQCDSWKQNFVLRERSSILLWGSLMFSFYDL